MLHCIVNILDNYTNYKQTRNVHVKLSYFASDILFNVPYFHFKMYNNCCHVSKMKYI